ncbi:MAG: TolC family protein [Verrucomicrobia bacterium]|nr:TolC family protein [Verrucomicrobiota bacterium]
MQVTRSLLAALVAMAALPMTGEETRTRQLSLEDCIQLALQHNLDIQVVRREPAIAELNLSLAYAGYDPVFSAGYNHFFNQNPGAFNPNINLFIPGSQTEGDAANLGLSGLLPTGLSYSLTGQTAESEGSQRTVIGNTVVDVPFQNANSSAGIQLRQPLLKNFWIDGTRLNITLSRKNLKISDLVVRRQIMTTVAAVEQAYYQLIAAMDAVNVQRAALQLAEKLLAENRKRVEVGVLAPLDEKEAESQVAASRAALLGAENSVTTAQNALKQLFTANYLEWHGVLLEPTAKLSALPQTFNRQDSWQRGLSLRPDLEQARIELEKSNVSLRYTKNQLFPQLDVVGSYGQSGAGNTFGDSLRGTADAEGTRYGYGVELSIPLSNRAARQRHRIAKEQIEQQVLRLKQLEQSILVEIDNAIAQARTSLQQVEASKAAVEFAEQALAAEQKKLESGKSTSFQVLTLQRTLTQRRYEYLSALTGYNVSLARLALSEGSTLERNNITVEVR